MVRCVEQLQMKQTWEMSSANLQGLNLLTAGVPGHGTAVGKHGQAALGSSRNLGKAAAAAAALLNQAYGSQHQHSNFQRAHKKQ
jgi:hypothetical protein